MRLQSAIFSLEDTLLTPEPPFAARAGLDKVLSIFKMESVWMYAVSSQSRAAAEETLARAGLAEYFRGVLTEDVALCPADSGTMFERAMRRLHSNVEDTVVFAGRLRALENAKEAGFRTVAVRGAAGEDEWRAMCAAATETLERYEEYLER